MKRTFEVNRLARAEHCGDWHDKPVKWIAICAQDPAFTQKFFTKKDALTWAKVAKPAGTFTDAYHAYQGHP